jgi:hypothetical protein
MFLFFTTVYLLSCVSPPKTNTDDINSRELENHAEFARVIFYNYSREDIYLRMMEHGKSEVNIGTINRNEYGRLNRVDSLIPSRKSAEFIILPGRYTIVPMKDEYGNKKADFNEYEEFRFFPSEEPYIIHLFPKHERTTTVAITSGNSQANSRNSLLPFFDIQFSDEMIRPLVKRNIELIGEDKKSIKIDIQWHSNYKLTIRPQEPLHPSTQYYVVVEIGARNIECEQIKEAVTYSFRTGNIVDSVSPFDTSAVKYDTSIPGYIRLDWSLPPGANGSEMRIWDSNNKLETFDLQAKTYYSFSSNDEILSIRYKIVPYGMINGGKVYNQTDNNRLSARIPYSILYGITYAITANTVDRLEFRFNTSGGIRMPPDFEFILRNAAGGPNLAVLNLNSLTYTANPPPLIPDEAITYNLIVDNAVDYSFTVTRPADSEFYGVFEKKVIQDMEAIAKKFIAIDKKSFAMSGELAKDRSFFNEKRNILIAVYSEYTGYAYPKAHNMDGYKKRVQSNEVFLRIRNLYEERLNLLVENLIVSTASGYNTAEERIRNTKSFLDSILKNFETYEPWLAVKDKKNVKTAIEKVNKMFTRYSSPFFWGIGTSFGSSFTAPWMIGTVQFDFSPFSYTIIELGCDFGLIHSYERKDIEYWSLYPFGHLVFSPNIKKYENRKPFVIYAGIGGGAMLSSYKTSTEDNFLVTPAVDLTGGFYLGSEHHCIHVSYTLRTTLNAINHKTAFGYTYRF